jgi:very-short-patch-repair endonuclease
MSVARVPPELLGRPFLRADARACGVTDASLQSRPWLPVLRGVWRHESLPDDRPTRVAAARLVVPDGGVFVNLTAAWLYGADVRRAGDLDVHVGFPPGRRIRRQQFLVVTQETLDDEDVAWLDGLAVTTPVRTAFDALRLLRGTERLVVADALCRLGLTTVSELRAYFGARHRLRNLRVGARLVDLVEPLAESPMETRLRVALIDGGLPRPVAQFVVLDGKGRFVARLDLAYVVEKVAVEFDGAWHWDRRRDDDRRRDRLRALGWDVLVFSAEDLRTPEVVVAKVAAALRRRVAQAG